ncbi:MAG: type II toxin-antitoxin system Phd/YefM family antitoxin [Deltaproteobacteria bacterium]|nr:type II toxin-antitoxin system Phd/YefM family antitoxin [Deltaproteobacteria bacterium]
MTITAAELHANAFKLLDHVSETGEPLKISRNGHILEIIPLHPKVSRLHRLTPHPDFVRAELDEFVHFEWISKSSGRPKR